MSTARTQVADLLASTLGNGITVMPYAREIDPPSKSTVMVRIDEVRPSASAGGFREYAFALVLVAAKTTAGPADDELDDLLEDVLYAVELNEAKGLVLGTASRATYQESNPAYEVAITVTIKKE